jgi:hypothetical protein
MKGEEEGDLSKDKNGHIGLNTARGQGFAALPLGVDRLLERSTRSHHHLITPSLFHYRRAICLFHQTAQKHEDLKSSKELEAIHRWQSKALEG